jgi:hypothetical protein
MKAERGTRKAERGPEARAYSYSYSCSYACSKSFSRSCSNSCHPLQCSLLPMRIRFSEIRILNAHAVGDAAQ